jgi:hypothetical protein
LVVFTYAATPATLQSPTGDEGNHLPKEEEVNSVHLIGRLATDVEVKEVNGGSKVSSFILAVDRNAEEAEVALLRHLAER